MQAEDYIRTIKTIGTGLFAFVAYASISLLNLFVVCNLLSYPLWVTLYSFFIYFYSYEQKRIASVREEPVLMAIVTIINLVLIYIYEF